MGTVSIIDLDQFENEDLFTLLGLEDISNKDKDALVDQLNHTVMARVYYNIRLALDPHKREEFDEMSSDEMVPFLLEEGFNLPQLILEEAIRYRAQIVQLFKSRVAILNTNLQAA
ncbi:spore coat CotO family protein [Patescibacteria group bacterium]|nr:spore coat CotO family protein [Patescibacteria group bacterium]